jgi:hypothetical protein
LGKLGGLVLYGYQLPSRKLYKIGIMQRTNVDLDTTNYQHNPV